MKNSLKMLAAALAAVSAMSCAGVTAFADKLKTVDGVMYRYSDSGEVKGKYTGWANTKKGRVCYKNGVKITGKAVINDICYSFGKDGILKGKYTGVFGGVYREGGAYYMGYDFRRYYKDGVLVKNAAVMLGDEGDIYGADSNGILHLVHSGDINPGSNTVSPLNEMMYGGERLIITYDEEMMYGSDGKVYVTRTSFREDESFDPRATVDDELTALRASQKPIGKVKYVTGELTDDFDAHYYSWGYEWNVFLTRESEDSYWLTMVTTKPVKTYKGQNVYLYFKALRYV